MSEDFYTIVENDACKVTREVSGDTLMVITAFEQVGEAKKAVGHPEDSRQFIAALEQAEELLLKEQAKSMSHRGLIIDFGGAQAAPVEVLKLIGDSAEVLENYQIHVGCTNMGYGIKSGFKAVGYHHLAEEHREPLVQRNPFRARADTHTR